MPANKVSYKRVSDEVLRDLIQKGVPVEALRERVDSHDSVLLDTFKAAYEAQIADGLTDAILLATKGDPEAAQAALIGLGMPAREAIKTADRAFRIGREAGIEPQKAPQGIPMRPGARIDA
jgi:hypothetical protein